MVIHPRGNTRGTESGLQAIRAKIKMVNGGLFIEGLRYLRFK